MWFSPTLPSKQEGEEEEKEDTINQKKGSRGKNTKNNTLSHGINQPGTLQFIKQMFIVRFQRRYFPQWKNPLFFFFWKVLRCL